MRVPTLTEEELQEHLPKLPGWTRQGEVIQKTYAFADFAHAMEFVNFVAETAEAVDHHPDMYIRFRRVTLALTTHDSGGLTENDVDFAATCDDLADGIGA